MSYIEANRAQMKQSINKYYKQEKKFAPIGKIATANGSIALWCRTSRDKKLLGKNWEQKRDVSHRNNVTFLVDLHLTARFFYRNFDKTRSLNSCRFDLSLLGSWPSMDASDHLALRSEENQMRLPPKQAKGEDSL